MRRLFLCLFLSLGLGLLNAHAQQAAGQKSDLVSGMTVRISAFSGKPVPRFESLKYVAVHGRTGPSLEYPIAWRYERQGLPVVVLKESRDWLMVRDPSGDEVWMHSRTLGGQPGVLIYGDAPVELRRKPKDSSRILARMEPGTIATLIGCDGEFCEIYVSHRRGWASKMSLWGAPGTQARPVDIRKPVMSAERVVSE